MDYFRKLLLVVLCTFSVSAYCQPGDPGDDPDNPVPIGGLEILLIGGAALGVRKIVKKN